MIDQPMSLSFDAVCLLQTMKSRTRAMKPKTPPPVPYCHASAWIEKTGSSVASGAAKANAARASWRMSLYIACRVYVICLVGSVFPTERGDCEAEKG